MNARLGSSRDDGALLLGNSGFNFEDGASIFAGGGRGSIFPEERKSVVFNVAEPDKPAATPGFESDSGSGTPDSGSTLGDPGGFGDDGNDGSSGVAW